MMLPAPPAKTVPALVPAVVPAIPAIFRGRLKGLYPLYRSFELWSDADGLRMSAAMSFYGILSLAPLLVLLVAVVGWWLDRDALVGSLTEQIGDLVGARGAEVVSAALESARQPEQGIFASVLAFALLLMGATGVFAELQSAFERLWTQGTDVTAKGAWWYSATLRLRGVAYVLAIGFLMLVSLVISSLLGVLEQWGGQRLGLQALLGVLNQAVSLIIIASLFVALMRMSAGPHPRLRYLVIGAAVGAVLFGLGKYGLALYLSTAAVVSAYGAAGSLVVLLMWIYFASAVLLYAASCARVLAEQQGEFNAAAVSPIGAAVAGAHEADSHVAALVAEPADQGVERARVNAEHETHRYTALEDSSEPTGAGISPLTGVLAMALAAAGYVLSKRLGKEHAEKSLSVSAYRAGAPNAPAERVAPRTSTACVNSRSRIGRGMSVLGTGVKGASFLARHVPAKWATLGIAASGVLSKWRQKKAEYDMADAIAKVEADVRALRRMSRGRKR